MEDKKTLADYQKTQRELAERLKRFGVKLENAQELSVLLQELDDMERGIDGLRSEQFYNDARGFMIEVKAATDKNVARLAASLRIFAEYIARELGIPESEIEARIDEIPPIKKDLYE